MLSAPSGLRSPTTAQTLDVPISNPTMIEEAGSNMFFLGQFWGLRTRRGDSAGFQPADRQVIGYGQVEAGDGLAKLLSLDKNLMPAPQLVLQIQEAKGDLAALISRDHQHLRAG